MPPTLRWMMALVPLREEERTRLAKERAEAKESVPNMERVLIAADASANGVLAAHLAGLFAGGQRLLTTVVAMSGDAAGATSAFERVRQAAASCKGRLAEQAPTTAIASLDDLIQGRPGGDAASLAQEAAKGYSIAFIGLDRPIAAAAHRFDTRLDRLIAAFDRPVAIALNGRRDGVRPAGNILVPTGGTAHARLATEVALALAKAAGGRLTALHVFDPHEDTDMLRGRLRRGLGVAVLRDVRRLARRSDVPGELGTATHTRPELAIRRFAASREFDLVVLGASLRVGERKFLGPRSAALIEAVKAPLLLIAQ
jgi:nucleotide-binding universal stress UspA family protein